VRCVVGRRGGQRCRGAGERNEGRPRAPTHTTPAETRARLTSDSVSSALVASSSSSTWGWRTRARAMAIRCFWPPLSTCMQTGRVRRGPTVRAAAGQLHVVAARQPPHTHATTPQTHHALFAAGRVVAGREALDEVVCVGLARGRLDLLLAQRVLGGDAVSRSRGCRCALPTMIQPSQHPAAGTVRSSAQLILTCVGGASQPSTSSRP
jgi:hypothetical protein